MKIDKYIAQNGFCSRRAAVRYIETGKVLINGKIANYKTEVNPGDTIIVLVNLFLSSVIFPHLL